MSPTPTYAARFVGGLLGMTQVPGQQMYDEARGSEAIDRLWAGIRLISVKLGTHDELCCTPAVPRRQKRKHDHHRDSSLDDALSSGPAPPMRCRAMVPVWFSEIWFCESAKLLR